MIEVGLYYQFNFIFVYKRKFAKPQCHNMEQVALPQALYQSCKSLSRPARMKLQNKCFQVCYTYECTFYGSLHRGIRFHQKMEVLPYR